MELTVQADFSVNPETYTIILGGVEEDTFEGKDAARQYIHKRMRELGTG